MKKWRKGTRVVLATNQMQRRADELHDPAYDGRVEEPPDTPPPTDPRQSMNPYNAFPFSQTNGQPSMPVSTPGFNDNSSNYTTAPSTSTQPYNQQPWQNQGWQSQSAYASHFNSTQSAYAPQAHYGQPYQNFPQQPPPGRPSLDSQQDPLQQSSHSDYSQPSQGYAPSITPSDTHHSYNSGSGNGNGYNFPPPDFSPNGLATAPSFHSTYSDGSNQYSQPTIPQRAYTYNPSGGSPEPLTHRTWTAPVGGLTSRRCLMHPEIELNYVGKCRICDS